MDAALSPFSFLFMVLGGEGSGKTTLLAQLRTLAETDGTQCANGQLMCAPPPTTGQEIEKIDFRSCFRWPPPRPPPPSCDMPRMPPSPPPAAMMHELLGTPPGSVSDITPVGGGGGGGGGLFRTGREQVSREGLRTVFKEVGGRMTAVWPRLIQTTRAACLPADHCRRAVTNQKQGGSKGGGGGDAAGGGDVFAGVIYVMDASQGAVSLLGAQKFELLRLFTAHFDCYLHLQSGTELRWGANVSTISTKTHDNDQTHEDMKKNHHYTNDHRTHSTSVHNKKITRSHYRSANDDALCGNVRQHDPYPSPVLPATLSSHRPGSMLSPGNNAVLSSAFSSAASLSVGRPMCVRPPCGSVAGLLKQAEEEQAALEGSNIGKDSGHPTWPQQSILFGSTVKQTEHAEMYHAPGDGCANQHECDDDETMAVAAGCFDDDYDYDDDDTDPPVPVLIIVNKCGMPFSYINSSSGSSIYAEDDRELLHRLGLGSLAHLRRRRHNRPIGASQPFSSSLRQERVSSTHLSRRSSTKAATCEEEILPLVSAVQADLWTGVGLDRVLRWVRQCAESST